MTVFQISDPSLESQWRSIVLFGRNVASYKFALAAALLELKAPANDLVRLETLAEPFARQVSRHLQLADRQATSPRSRFLDACRSFNAGELSLDRLNEETVRLGFVNVIDAFHVVGSGEVPDRFFLDERKTTGGIRVTDNFYRLLETQQEPNLPLETEARWRLVETAWELNLPRHLIDVSYDKVTEELVAEDRRRRRAITKVQPALNGYQRGRCFYCYRDLAIEGMLGAPIDVDHFIPWRLARHLPRRFGDMIDGVWNLVLSCHTCNRGPRGKFDDLPSLRLLQELDKRNEFLIQSNHPLRETLIRQTGETTDERRAFLQAAYQEAHNLLPGAPWEPPLIVGLPL
jgi:hypothetical protein